MTSSVNKVINVQAPPYNAYCDAASPGTLSLTSGSAVTSGITFTSADVGKTFTMGGAVSGAAYHMQGTILSVTGGNATLSVNAPVTGTFLTGHWLYGHDDKAAIQSAFTDALSGGQSIQFPAGKCLTSTINYQGQSFFGAGNLLTFIWGMPGQDVFSSPDMALGMNNATVRDLTIGIDTSINKASSVVGGDNTFPNRISGTAGGTTPLANPILPDGLQFGAGSPVNCFGSMTSGANILTLCGSSSLTSVPPSFLVGQPVSVSNAGTSGGVLTSTVASVTDASHIVLAANATTTTTTATGYIGTTATVVTKTPWYFGNCGMAFPSSSGAALAGLSYSIFRNLIFVPINRAYANENFTCGMFIQANQYNNTYDNVRVNYQWGGIIEAPPASNNSSYFAFTPDTNNYSNMQFYQNSIPMVWYNGFHRMATGISIYSLGTDFDMGLMMVSTPLGSSNSNNTTATISRYYNECNTWNGGEIMRVSGFYINILGGALGQCASKGFINWLANFSTSNATFGPGLHISGYNNTLSGTVLNTTAQVVDTGWNNRVYGGASGRSREMNVDPVHAAAPVFSLSGDWLAAGITTTPVPNLSDLVTSCNDYYVATSGAFGVSCANDPASLTSVYMTGPAGGYFTQGAPGNYPLMLAGSRFPMTQVYAITQGRCPGATGGTCTGSFGVSDINTSATIKSCTVTYGTSWTVDGGPNSPHPCLVNLGSTSPLVSSGDAIGWGYGSMSNTPTSLDVAMIAYEPLNSDVLQEVLTSPTFNTGLANSIQATTSGTPPQITAKSWIWGSAGVVDPTSPVGYSTATTNANSLTSANGSTNMMVGPTGIFQAAPSIVTVSTQSPTTISNTLGAAQTNVATTLTVTTPSTAAYPTSGCFFIDQELECWSGALTVGTTAITVTRGVWNTVAQAHAINAPAAVAPHGRIRSICNAATIGDVNIIFLNTWTYYSAFLPYQNCSGYPITLQLVSLTDVPAGQLTKLASVSVAQLGSSASSPPSVSAVPTVNAGVCWKTATQLGTCTAGTWPNCTTCN